MIYTVLKLCMPVVFMLALGMVCRKLNILNDDSIAGIKKLITSILLPVSLFVSMSSINLSMDVLFVILTGFIMNIIPFAVSSIIQKKFNTGEKYYSIILSAYEVGLLGLALFPLIFSDSSAAGYLASFDIANAFFYFFIILPAINSMMSENVKYTVPQKILMVVKSPTIIAISLGLILNFTGLYEMIMSSVLADTVLAIEDMITVSCTPLVLIIVGYGLSFRKDLIKRIVKISMERLALMAINAVIALLLLRLFGVSDIIYYYAAVFMCALPAPFATSAYVSDEKENDFISTQLSMYVVITFICFVIMILI